MIEDEFYFFFPVFPSNTFIDILDYIFCLFINNKHLYTRLRIDNEKRRIILERDCMRKRCLKRNRRERGKDREREKRT